MTKLPVPAGMEDVSATGIDPTGKYIIGLKSVGHDADRNEDFQPILWTDGKPQALPLHGKWVTIDAVNASGVIVGLNTYTPDPGQQNVYRYENGVYTKLKNPPGHWNLFPAPMINAAGDTVINAEPSDEADSNSKHVITLLWRAGSTAAIQLPLPAGATASAITDDGTIVGYLGGGKDGLIFAPYVWDQQGNGRKLELPAGMSGRPLAARGQWATGGLWPSNSDGGTTALWNLKTGKVTDLKTQGPGRAVNAAGLVVTAGPGTYGLVLRNGVPVELAVPSGQISAPRDVSDTGIVVGIAVIKSKGNQDDQNIGPRLWRC